MDEEVKLAPELKIIKKEIKSCTKDIVIFNSSDFKITPRTEQTANSQAQHDHVWPVHHYLQNTLTGSRESVACVSDGLTQWSCCNCCCRDSAFRCSNRSICSSSQTSRERSVSKCLLIELCSWDFTWTNSVRGIYKKHIKVVETKNKYRRKRK